MSSKIHFFSSFYTIHKFIFLGLFETCCTIKADKPIIPPNTKVNVGCGIRNEDGVGFRITGDKDNEAQFGLL